MHWAHHSPARTSFNRPSISLYHHHRASSVLLRYSTMPVSVDDPFLLASFTSTTHAHQQNPAVTCTAEGSSDLSGQDVATSLLVVAVQGQGVQLYNVSAPPRTTSLPLYPCTINRMLIMLVVVCFAVVNVDRRSKVRSLLLYSSRTLVHRIGSDPSQIGPTSQRLRCHRQGKRYPNQGGGQDCLDVEGSFSKCRQGR